jgi:hypothetical protein
MFRDEGYEMGKRTETDTDASTINDGAAPGSSAAPGTAGPATPSGAAEIETDIRFDLLFTAIYHDICEQQLKRLNRWLTLLVLVLGSGAVFGISVKIPGLGQIAGLLVAIISGAQLVWDFPDTARKHEDLRRKAYGLLADLDRGHDEREINARLNEIFGDEPPMRDKARVEAHNKAVRSLYGKDGKKLML